MRNPTLTVAALLVALAGCRSTWYGARFAPAPLEARLQPPDDPAAEARALVTVRGIRRADAREDRPVEVVVLLRLDNMGSVPLALVPDGFDLVTADLVSLAPARLEPEAGAPLADGESRTWTVCFGLPADRDVERLDWSGLNLKWTVSFDGRSVVTGATFDRFDWAEVYGWYDPWYDPYWRPYPYPYAHSRFHVGIGVGGTFDE